VTGSFAEPLERKDVVMISGLALFTLFHVLLSLAGIVAGVVVIVGLLKQRSLERWTVVFLSTTILTSVTGFFFPFTHFLPSHATGIVSLLALPIAVVARYVFHLRGGWARAYAVTSVFALYLNVFVLIVQLFQKVPFLRALAPTQTEPAFLLAQLANLALFIAIGVLGTLKSKPQTVVTAARPT
jgi:hypothetical protein